MTSRHFSRLAHASTALTLLAALPLYAAANPLRTASPFVRNTVAHTPHAGAQFAGMRPSMQIVNNPPVGMQFLMLLTDGRVIAQSNASNTWYALTPDNTGNYSNGTWKQLATLPSGYAPSAFSSAVLADGRVAISGGEYNIGGRYELQLTNLGAIYDPVADKWTRLPHPRGWQFIGDSPNSVLPNGRFLVGQKLTKQVAYLDPKTLKWTKPAGSIKSKDDWNSEEGWTLLPDGTILTEDVLTAPNSEIYNPNSGKWNTAGSTIVDLHSPSGDHQCIQYGPKPKDCYLPPGEIGPPMLRPDGTVFATGSGSGPSGGGPGHTAIYHTQGAKAGTWTVGPDFPNGDNAGDSFSVLLPSGNVLVFGVFGYLYEFDGTHMNQETFYSDKNPILLPTGQVMMIGYQTTIYTPAGQPQNSWLPTISSVPSSVKRGMSYAISGTQFNGLSQAVSFGDEFQNATNYPLVRITNGNTGHVFYARTHDHSTMAVATGSMTVSTTFDVPSRMETGASSLQVVANGIASNPASITVH